MSLEIKIDKIFKKQISIFIIFFISILTIILSNFIYSFEQELSLNDASEYIALAKDPRNYFTLPHQGALRFFPSFIVHILNLAGLTIEQGFKYLTYITFILLNLKIFHILSLYNFKNYLILSSVAILVFSNHSIIYTVFNYYQLIDLFTYVLILFFIELHLKNNLKLLFLISLLSIFTKEYLLIMVIFIHFFSSLQFGIIR